MTCRPGHRSRALRAALPRPRRILTARSRSTRGSRAPLTSPRSPQTRRTISPPLGWRRVRSRRHCKQPRSARRRCDSSSSRRRRRPRPPPPPPRTKRRLCARSCSRRGPLPLPPLPSQQGAPTVAPAAPTFGHDPLPPPCAHASCPRAPLLLPPALARFTPPPPQPQPSHHPAATHPLPHPLSHPLSHPLPQPLPRNPSTRCPPPGDAGPGACGRGGAACIEPAGAPCRPRRGARGGQGRRPPRAAAAAAAARAAAGAARAAARAAAGGG